MQTKEQNRDGLYVQLAELEAQRNGISPKLGLHIKITQQIKEIREKLGDQDAPVTMPMATSASGTRLKYGNQHIRPSNLCAHKHYNCRGTNCEKPVKLAGACKACGGQKYKTYCTDHGARS